MSKKFTTQSELDLFKALQKFGKLSHEKLAKKTKLFISTIHYAFERIKEKKFFQIKAIPNLGQFPELPIAFISFKNIHPIKLRILKKTYLNKDEVRAFITNGKEVFIILMHTNKDRLSELAFEIMEKAQANFGLHILSPTISKLDLTIPDKILDEIYPDLMDRRKRK